MPFRLIGLATIALALIGCGTTHPPASAAASSVLTAALLEPDATTPNVSTEEMEAAIASGDVLILDTRPRREWAISHIPTALNVAPKPGTSKALYVSDVAEIGRLAGGDKRKPLIVYCNGPFCGKARRIADELVAAGFTDVRRYQLGAPVWRALGKMMVIEPEAIPYVMSDPTAVLLDARDVDEFTRGSVVGARSIPRAMLTSGKDSPAIRAAKEDGRLPMHDHNTRIVVFGRDGAQARALAEVIAEEAFHNVAVFDGTFEEFSRAALLSR